MSETVLQFRIRSSMYTENPADESLMEKRGQEHPPPHKFFWKKRGGQTFYKDTQTKSSLPKAFREKRGNLLSVLRKVTDAKLREKTWICFRPGSVFKPTMLHDSSMIAVLHCQCCPMLSVVNNFCVSLE